MTPTSLTRYSSLLSSAFLCLVLLRVERWWCEDTTVLGFGSGIRGVAALSFHSRVQRKLKQQGKLSRIVPRREAAFEIDLLQRQNHYGFWESSGLARMGAPWATASMHGCLDKHQMWRLGATNKLNSAETGHKETEEVETEVQMQQSTLRVQKPLGIIIEERNLENPEAGVQIASLNPKGNAAMSKKDGDGFCGVSIRDHIVAINGQDCRHCTFEQVMEMLTSLSPADNVEVQLTLERPMTSSNTKFAIVEFPNGVSITAKSGEVLGALAQEAGCGAPKISYSCRNGGCGTCEHAVDLYQSQDNDSDEGSRRYLRPCVSRIPRKIAKLRLLSPYDE
jgi:hypothetical protein